MEKFVSIEGIEPAGIVDSRQLDRKTRSVVRTDSVNISAESEARGETIELATNLAINSPEIRTTLVNETRSKVKEPSFINNKVMNIVADKILDSFGI